MAIALNLILSTLIFPIDSKEPDKRKNALNFFKKFILNNSKSWTNLEDLVIFKSSNIAFQKHLTYAEHSKLLKVKELKHDFSYQIESNSEIHFLGEAMANCFGTPVVVLTENYEDHSFSFSSFKIDFVEIAKHYQPVENVKFEINLNEHLYASDQEEYVSLISDSTVDRVIEAWHFPVDEESQPFIPLYKSKEYVTIATNNKVVLGMYLFYDNKSKRAVFLNDNVLYSSLPGDTILTFPEKLRKRQKNTKKHKRV
jgi:hypothetical protein